MPFRTLPSHHSLKKINIPGVDCLLVKWAPHHARSINTRILDTQHHPNHAQFKRRWESRTDPLWWNCLASIRLGGNRKVVRGWLSNRGRVAITNALKNRGYAKNGAKLWKELSNPARADLVGSLHLQVLPRMLHTSWKGVCKQAELIIAAIEERQIDSACRIQNRIQRRLQDSAWVQKQ